MARPQSAQKTWNDQLKCTIRWPSVHIGGIPTAYGVMAVIESVEASGIGYNHALRSGMYSWNQIMVTLKNEGQTGRLLVAQTEPAVAMLFWLMKNEQMFDVILDEIAETDGNPGNNQWQNNSRILLGCKVDPMDERYDGDLPFITVPFTWSRYVYTSVEGSQTIGDGSFINVPAGTVPDGSTSTG